MSRVGLNPITIEEGVTVTISEKVVNVKGSKGEINIALPEGLSVENNEGTLNVKRANDGIQTVSNHGTVRALIANAIKGVKDGYTKKLEIIGVGYRVKQEGDGISMSLGWTHPVLFKAPEGVQLSAPDETTIIVSGYDKQKVGEIAAKIREIKKPEPYKGKGIRYEGEYVRQKSAKSASK